MSRCSAMRLPKLLCMSAQVLVVGGVSLLLLLLLHLEGRAQNQPGHIFYLPLVSAPPCQSYRATAWLETPDFIHAGSAFTTTIALRNDGCSHLGMPIYALDAGPDVVDPQPYQASSSIGPGDVDRHTFTMVAPITASEAITVTGGAVFEVLMQPGGPFSHGNAGTQIATIPVEG